MNDDWITKKQKGYTLMYIAADQQEITAYQQLLDLGVNTVEAFFNAPFKKEFDVYVHPNRHSMDSSWQKDWKMPDFTSQCWMVASGVANRLDMIAPGRWDKEACEHSYTDTQKTQQLIAHELVHVYHGQINASPDFSNTEGIDWFVEGLAAYASGQCDTSRMMAVRNAVSAHTQPARLDSFWTGNLKYGLSGSVVMYIDKKYGRNTLKELLPFSKKAELLLRLHTSETELIAGWKKFILNR